MIIPKQNLLLEIYVTGCNTFSFYIMDFSKYMMSYNSRIILTFILLAMPGVYKSANELSVWMFQKQKYAHESYFRKLCHQSDSYIYNAIQNPFFIDIYLLHLLP